MEAEKQGKGDEDGSDFDGSGSGDDSGSDGGKTTSQRKGGKSGSVGRTTSKAGKSNFGSDDDMEDLEDEDFGDEYNDNNIGDLPS